MNHIQNARPGRPGFWLRFITFYFCKFLLLTWCSECQTRMPLVTSLQKKNCKPSFFPVCFSVYCWWTCTEIQLQNWTCQKTTTQHIGQAGTDIDQETCKTVTHFFFVFFLLFTIKYSQKRAVQCRRSWVSVSTKAWHCSSERCSMHSRPTSAEWATVTMATQPPPQDPSSAGGVAVASRRSARQSLRTKKCKPSERCLLIFWLDVVHLLYTCRAHCQWSWKGAVWFNIIKRNLRVDAHSSSFLFPVNI